MPRKSRKAGSSSFCARNVRKGKKFIMDGEVTDPKIGMEIAPGPRLIELIEAVAAIEEFEANEPINPIGLPKSARLN